MPVTACMSAGWRATVSKIADGLRADDSTMHKSESYRRASLIVKEAAKFERHEQKIALANKRLAAARERRINTVCRHCDGSGKRRNGRACMFCNGRGRG